MPSSPDTLKVILTGFISMLWSTATESTILGLPDFYLIVKVLTIPGRVIPKTLKMIFDTSLLNTQQYKVHIKGKAEQSRERSSTLPKTLVL